MGVGALHMTILSVGHTNSRSLNATTEGGTGHPYWLRECIWGFVLRLKGFHIPLAQGSEVTVYTMLPPVCRFNPFCPKAERERTANSRSQTQSNTGSVPDSDQLHCYSAHRQIHEKSAPKEIIAHFFCKVKGTFTSPLWLSIKIFRWILTSLN